MFTAIADSPGTWGKDLTITTSSSPAAPSNATASYPMFNVSVKLSGTEVENWNEVSLDPSNNRYISTVINTYSKYITVASTAGATIGWAIKEDPADIFTFATYSAAYGSTTVAASVAVNGTDVAVEDYQSAIGKIDSIEGSLLINVPGQTNSSIVTTALNTAEARGDSFVIIDPAASGTTLLGVTGAIASYPKSSYGAVYYPQLVMSDPTKTGPAAVRNTFPGGAVAGAYIIDCRARADADAKTASRIHEKCQLAQPDIGEFALRRAESIRSARQLQGDRDIFEGGHGRHEMEGLEDDADPLPAKPRQRVFAKMVDPLAADGDLARVRALQPSHGHEQGRFARAGGPDQTNGLAFVNFQAYAFQDMDAGGALAQTEMDVAHRNGG
jgi:hypothetical protein